MKKLTKLLGIVLIIALVMSMGIFAYAAPSVTKTDLVTGDNAGTASITVTLPTVAEGATANNTYKIYKVFDASTSTAEGAGISYTLVSGKTEAPEGFSVDAAGNVTLTRTTGDLTTLTAAEISAIQGYITDAMLAATVTTTAADTSFTVDTLPYGYYYITTTTGTVVTINSTNPNANVSDKNEVPPVTKVISATDKGSYDEDGKKALAEVGSNVTYTATVTKKNGAENYVFHDVMDNTLSYNGDVKVYSDAACTTEVATANYSTTTATGDTLTVTFDNDYMAGLDNNTVLYIQYTAKVTSAALQDEPAKNTARLSYGHTPGENSTPVVQTETYNAKISVLKKDGKGTEATTDDTPLSGAGFKLYRIAGAAEAGYAEATEFVSGTTYYTKDGETYTAADITSAEAFAAAGTLYIATAASEGTKEYYHLDTTVTPNVVTWGTKAAGDEHTSDADGNVAAFTGLSDGTYYLEETTVPAGYNAASDTQVVIAAHDYTADNLKQEKTVVNNKGTVLPSTGGIGTTIFYVVGGVMVLAALVLLITKKRMSRDS